ncbi:glycerophosphodiester phosphodiesterase [Massilia sp. YIM B02763]|uniref:glycerophosphodiester phosphodiesterase n=1 Tax=Massilia sp. YIM B02763 TaxID=3050130 RepID=UPI0025B64352|nr:glycerophosphodiester phosphodiesterase [Massilia sp. YIM B02763]MDN4053189.1 glycerophosphodiester phosphodiesterase [Massilia sp. YIM B02763]
MWPYPRMLAHRGGGTLAPENTLAGVKRGMAAGFRAIEYDVMLARDGVPVVLHDPLLGRTVAAPGSVTDYDALALATLDAGSWFGPEYAGEPVPLFAEFAQYCKAHGVWMNIELKPAPGFDAATGTTVARMTSALFADALAAGERGRVPLLSSFSEAALQAARAAAPRLPRALLVDALPPDWRERAAGLGVVALHVDHLALTAAQAADVKAAGLGLFCYTVNDPARARELLGWGVDAFCTDRIDLIGPDFR